MRVLMNTNLCVYKLMHEHVLTCSRVGHGARRASVFFASYMLIVGVVLLNIVVAVLLDEFINTVSLSLHTVCARARERSRV